MMHTTDLALPQPAVIKDYLALTKPRITGLVLFTTFGGLWLAPGPLSLSIAVLTLLATACGVGSANALNCFIERDVDALMERTRDRPLPAGRILPKHAFWFGLSLGFMATVLAFSVNALTGFLGVLSILVYVLVYTPMKRLSWTALLVGAIPGALPPLIGWVAMTRRADLAAWVLFAILFLWQLAHFVAIALFREEDYRKAGIRVLPLVLGSKQAKLFALLTTLLLAPTAWLLTYLRVAGTLYGISASVAGLAFIASAVYAYFATDTRRAARLSFITSLLYLTFLFLMLAIDAG